MDRVLQKACELTCWVKLRGIKGQSRAIPKAVLVVGISPSVNRLGTQLEQPSKDLLAYKVVLFVGGITETQHCKLHILKRGRWQVLTQQEPPAALVMICH